MNEYLTVERIEQLTAWALKVGVALAIFAGGWIVSKWIYALLLRGFRKAKLDEALTRFFASMGQYAVLAFAVIAALDKAGVETTSLAAVLAAAGLAVGLALQGSLGNFASGVLLLVFRPFTLKDRISIAGHVGQVEEIGLFATTLSTPAGERVIVPNGAVTADSIVNHSSTGKVRGSIDAGVAYGADIGEVMEVLERAAKRADLVLADPAPAVAFTEMAASSLNFAVHCWCEPKDLNGMKHNVRRSIYEHLMEAGIEIPFDQVVVHRAATDDAS